MVAKVIIGISTSALNRLFTYAIPEALLGQVEIGSVVSVPFGKGNRLKTAYVVGVEQPKQQYEYELKEICSVNEQVLVVKELIQLASWMQQRYQCSFNSAMRLMLPNEINVNLKTANVITADEKNREKLLDYYNSILSDGRMRKRREIVQYLLGLFELSQDAQISILEKDLINQFNTSNVVIKSLCNLGLFRTETKAYDREIGVLNRDNKDARPSLNPEQVHAVNQIANRLEDHNTFLLHGVTGSGKTEVYMNLIEEVLKRGKKAIVLIPEIGLTPQTIKRFTARFGSVVGVMHSKLNLGERYEQWKKASDGQIQIMVGVRSAVFTPFDNIGIIIIDESHEHTYKSGNTPKYHAREVAIKRGLYHKCPVVLGTATPSLESYYRAMHGHYTLLTLNKTAVSQAKKETVLVDMREELLNGNTSIISEALKVAMDKALKDKEQIILFINRRGYAGTVSCRSCGFVYTCEHCDVSMTYHKSNKRLICHMCGASKKMNKTCPACGSPYIKGFGIGTQKIELMVKKIFPEATIIRMDQDTTTTKHGHEKILDQFESQKADILIGTQMVTKGHDFHNVTVVGVLAADMSLNANDYKGGERTFQLITQVIGRAGRGAKAGKAFIQTYQPDDYAIRYALNEDYVGFFNEEILFRKAMIYPPFCHVLVVTAVSENETMARRMLETLLPLIEKAYDEKTDKTFCVLGPGKTAIGRIKNKYRYRLIVKGNVYKKLTLVMKELYNRKDIDETYKHVQLDMEMNPVGLQ